MWRVEERRGRDGLESLSGEWRDLETRCRCATPFQSPEWLIPWWTFFAHGELRIIAVYRDNSLCAMLPLVLEPTDDGCRVTLLGTGNTDHLDMLVDDRCRDVATAMAVDATTQCLATRDWCEFEQLSVSSPLMSTPAPFSWCWEEEQCDVCPALAIGGCAGADPLPPRRSADIRYARRRLTRRGSLAIELVRHDTLDENLAALLALHQARWEARRLPGVLGSNAVQRFLQRVAEGFLARGTLRFYALRLSGRIVAVHFGFQWRGRHYYYIGGFDPDFASLSVGSVVLDHAIRSAADEGASEFDFLRGAEPYKYRWGATDRPNYRRTLRRAVPS